MAVLEHSTYQVIKSEFIHNMADSLLNENENQSLNCPAGE